jgi:hypothetical protein
MGNKFVSVSNGLKITFGKSGFVADILSVSHSGVARALIETSHMGTPEPQDDEIGGKTFIVDPLEDPGQLQLQVHYDPSNPPKRTDPDDPESIEVEYRKPRGAATAARLVGEGWLQEWSAEMNLGAKMTATLTVKFTGLLNVVKAA